MSHANAPLTPTGRLRLARCIVEDGWPLRRAAERFGVSVTTARRWADRYRAEGAAGMIDRSSRPRHCPHRTPRRTERRVIGLRVSRRWGPARIAYHLGMHPSTVHKILTRYRCLRLSFIDPATGSPVRAARRRARRYEHAAAGDLVHVDIKKLGRIPDGGGHKVLGRQAGRKNRAGILSVFDITQTDLIDGEADHSTIAHRLTGTDDLGIIATMSDYLTAAGWNLTREELDGHTNGYTTSQGRRVVIEARLSPAHAAKTLIHEAAHITLGHLDAPHSDYLAHRGVMECEAESVAYVLAGLLGLDTSPYSIGYIAAWSDQDPDADNHGVSEEVHGTASRVLAAVHTLTEAIDPTTISSGRPLRATNTLPGSLIHTSSIVGSSRKRWSGPRPAIASSRSLAVCSRSTTGGTRPATDRSS